MIRWAQSIENMSYITEGKFYEVTHIDSYGNYKVMGDDGGVIVYGSECFSDLLEFDTYDDYAEAIDSPSGLNSGSIYKIYNYRISGMVGLIVEVKNDNGDFVEYFYNNFKPMKRQKFDLAEKIVAYRVNKIGTKKNVKLEKYKTYLVHDIRSDEVLVMCEDGSKRWYSNLRFEAYDTYKREILDNKKAEDIASLLSNYKGFRNNYTLNSGSNDHVISSDSKDYIIDDLPDYRVDPNKIKTQSLIIESSIHGQLTITNKKDGGNKMTNMTTKLTERFGTFGAVEGVALTMTGKLAFLGMDSNYYSYEDNTLVSNDDMVFEGFPFMAMPVLKSTLKAGDLIIQRDGSYAFVNNSGNYVNFKGEITPMAKTKHAMFGTALEYVSKVMDMGMGNMLGNADSQNPFENPMFMMMAMGKKDGASGGKDMMEMFMMSQMMSTQQPSDNPFGNPMFMMMFMGKDDKGGSNDMFKTMMMMNMMKNSACTK